ncbi:unnamed protein product [Leptidea sinapis]|uniref:TATA box-binding protein-associated factor RNA polymerase I subunit B n=1 Tax=Leptidea sinapis TaxID=189913 RepID=A0A5E4QCR6_9NEOP|nr:unnamed protein product [Leptidea sinapis]
MKTNPCNVCGCTDLKLLDGFYYCIECGTQDKNVQERVVEHLTQADGTITGLSTVRKIVTNEKEMGSEWNKWHGYNFVMAGLADELVGIGAKPSVKIKLLWIWIRYIKKFQLKQSESENEFTIRHDDEKSKYDTEKQENNETFTENCSSKEDSSGEESSDGGDDENDRTTTLKDYPEYQI